MDITLERILSLIPKKPDGKYVHGAKKDFALSIGYADGNIVSMWENGSSESYKLKLFEISAKYDVSVAWLKGETDEKKPQNAKGATLSEKKQALLKAIDSMTDEQCEAVLKLLGK